MLKFTHIVKRWTESGGRCVVLAMNNYECNGALHRTLTGIKKTGLRRVLGLGESWRWACIYKLLRVLLDLLSYTILG